MNEYLFYTTEGHTIPPNEMIEINNCQLLGRGYGETMQDAMKDLLNNNPWILESGFNVKRIMYEQVVTHELRSDISLVIGYLINEEERHYEELGKPKDHIFEVLSRLKEEVS